MGGKFCWFCGVFKGGKEGLTRKTGSKEEVVLCKLREGNEQNLSMFAMRNGDVLRQYVPEGGVERTQKGLSEERGKGKKNQKPEDELHFESKKFMII
jgi:hypothetical protein